MYPQRRVHVAATPPTSRRAAWKLLRLMVVSAGALVLGAAGATQGASATAAPQGFMERPVAPFADQAPPSEPSGHRPSPGTTSLLVKLNTNLSAGEARRLVGDNGGSGRAGVPAPRGGGVGVPSGPLQSIPGRYPKNRRGKSGETDFVPKAAAPPPGPP